VTTDPHFSTSSGTRQRYGRGQLSVLAKSAQHCPGTDGTRKSRQFVAAAVCPTNYRPTLGTTQLEVCNELLTAKSALSCYTATGKLRRSSDNYPTVSSPGTYYGCSTNQESEVTHSHPVLTGIRVTCQLLLAWES
jgi:hypothetical protein